jgi:HAD superfamily hydrolase (TIGR01450 family)
VVYAGGQALPHAVKSLMTARAGGCKLAFVTNNASRTPQEVAELLTSLGVEADPAEVATSAQAAASLLQGVLPAGARVLAVGGRGLVQALQAVGFVVVSRAEEEPAAVVQGYGPDVGWRDLAEAVVAVRGGARWVATNLDRTIPSERGILPGNGTLVAAVAAALGRQPDDVAGKPERPLHEEAVQRTAAERPLVVGDRLDTDIVGANHVGVPSLLVLTGVTTPAELMCAAANSRPTYVGEDLRTLHSPAQPSNPARQTGTGNQVAWAGWTAEDAGGQIVVRGSGNRLDALRAVLALAWPRVDAGEHFQLEVPAELEEWWEGSEKGAQSQ